MTFKSFNVQNSIGAIVSLFIASNGVFNCRAMGIHYSHRRQQSSKPILESKRNRPATPDDIGG